MEKKDNPESVMPFRPKFQVCSAWRSKRTGQRRARPKRAPVESLATAAKTSRKMVSPKKLADLHKVMMMGKITASRFGAPQDRNQKNSFQEQFENVLSSSLPHFKVESQTSDEDLVKFRDLAMIPRCHASLLERACFDHPDLAICSDRTFRWRQFAYETLEDLLYFLSSTRRGEMTEEACKHLNRLWKDAQGLGFDLSWLTCSVMSGLNSAYCLELMETLSTFENRKKHLEETRDTLRCQMSTMTMQLCEAEQELADLEKPIQMAKTNLDFTRKAFLYAV
ncbi:hypothetical protein PanWU01x14_032250 [Parasponia andersonii]|uniref:Phospholipase-like n=1 Tax=Parasponia andersonii TaxID=3476 RepID=A0A2P5DUD8_PARAD|nr:hypothetical protein PanWU01x14_032250 [Parasponia andersonii]